MLTAKAWNDLVRVNKWVNDTDQADDRHGSLGRGRSWNYPDDGYGDCEDYVLLKRRMLMQAGWPREALLITVVRDKKGDGHAVLTVKTDKGEFILDNQKRAGPALVRDRLPLRQAPVAERPERLGLARRHAPGRRHRHVTLMAPHPGLRKADHPHATPDRICMRPAPLPGDRPPVFFLVEVERRESGVGVRSSPRRSAECHPTRFSPFAYCCQRRT